MIKTRRAPAAATVATLLVVLFVVPLVAQPATNTAFDEPASNRLSVTSLDAESQLCMVCHNGTYGKRIELRPAGAPLEFEYGRTIKTKNHAIGMEYQVAYDANPKEYVAPTTLDKNIKLVEGKVGCLSCHIKREQLLAQATPVLQAFDNQCTNDKPATQRAFRGMNCLNCHRK